NKQNGRGRRGGGGTTILHVITAVIYRVHSLYWFNGVVVRQVDSSAPCLYAAVALCVCAHVCKLICVSVVCVCVCVWVCMCVSVSSSICFTHGTVWRFQ